MTSLILALTLVAVPASPSEVSRRVTPPTSPGAPLLPRGTPAKGCVVLEVQPSNPATKSRRREWTAREVVDLEFRGDVMRTALGKRIELRVLTPAGHLYQRLVATEGEHRRVANEGARGVTRAPGRRVVARLPIAGTSVTERGLFGRWTVVPHFAGEPDPCGAAVTFQLLP